MIELSLMPSLAKVVVEQAELDGKAHWRRHRAARVPDFRNRILQRHGPSPSLKAEPCGPWPLSVRPKQNFQAAPMAELEIASPHKDEQKIAYPVPSGADGESEFLKSRNRQDGFSETRLTKPIKLVNNKMHERWSAKLGVASDGNDPCRPVRSTSKDLRMSALARTARSLRRTLTAGDPDRSRDHHPQLLSACSSHPAMPPMSWQARPGRPPRKPWRPCGPASASTIRCWCNLSTTSTTSPISASASRRAMACRSWT